MAESNAYLGEYSTLSYVHQLRGERVNLGVLVWHPTLGAACRFMKRVGRVRCVDEEVDIDRVREQMEQVRQAFEGWYERDQSPLPHLSASFRHGLTVGAPTKARIQDPNFTLERLYSCLIAPEPFMRASSTSQFAQQFITRAGAILTKMGAADVQENFDERGAFQPVKVSLLYRVARDLYVWRAFSFASLTSVEDQLTTAKAIHAENEDLRRLPKYREARLSLAIQAPKPSVRAEWSKSLGWLQRDSDRVEQFEDKQSLAAKMPEVLGATLLRPA